MFIGKKVENYAKKKKNNISKNYIILTSCSSVLADKNILNFVSKDNDAREKRGIFILL
jgi:hypothetical protein